MVNYSSIEDTLYFANDGEIDLLTGSIAPSRFNQIIKRDIELANRNGSLLAIISLKINLPNLIEHKYNGQTVDQIKSNLESLLIEIHFQLKSILRSSDCISRVSTTGFWIFVNSANTENLSTLVARIEKLFTGFIDIAVVCRENNQDLSTWFEVIDQKHFRK